MTGSIMQVKRNQFYGPSFIFQEVTAHCVSTPAQLTTELISWTPRWPRLAAGLNSLGCSVAVARPNNFRPALTLFLICCLQITLSGCGGLNKTVESPGTLVVSQSSVTFGAVYLGQSVSSMISLSNQGSAPVNVTQLVVGGQSFSLGSQISLPLNIAAGDTYNFSLEFAPTSVGSASGQLTVVSNSTTNATAVVNLSGTGKAVAYQVELAWNPPISPSDPIAGYNIYRSPSGSSSFELLNTSIDLQTSYTDAYVQIGTTYEYVIKSVDDSGVESVPSSMFTASIP